jgi:hypothetical protein
MSGKGITLIYSFRWGSTPRCSRAVILRGSPSLQPAIADFLLTLRGLRKHILPKRRALYELHSVTTEKTVHLIITIINNECSSLSNG